MDSKQEYSICYFVFIDLLGFKNIVLIIERVLGNCLIMKKA